MNNCNVQNSQVEVDSERTQIQPSLFWQKLAWASVIFTVALGVRWLTWQDLRFEAPKVQEFVAKDYRNQANAIRAEGILSLFDANAESSNINFMLHPPGYPIVLAGAFALFGESDAVAQSVSMLADAVSAVVILLIASQLVSFGTGILAGFLAAFSPQFATNSVWLLPDVLAVLPILLAVYCLLRAWETFGLGKVLVCGMLIGLSCWIRANALLLAPFLALVCLLLFQQKRFLSAATLILGATLVIAPLTFRNYLIYDAFIPLSLGAGQTLIEGIGDYDKTGFSGFPKYDWDVTRQEAEIYNRPDYAHNLIQIDGIKRDRMRIARAFKFIKENPFWFFSVMFRRAFWMITPEKAPIVSRNVQISRSLEDIDETLPSLTLVPLDLARNGLLVAREATATVAPENNSFTLQTDRQKYSAQFVSPQIATSPNTDYVLRLNLALREGRVKIVVRQAESSQILAATIIDPIPTQTANEQPKRFVLIPFVSCKNAIEFVVLNEAPQAPTSIVEIHNAQLFELGAARNQWMLPLRLITSLVQKIFTLPVLLPLELLGLGLLIWRRKQKTLLILLAVPLYYFCVQSALHTEHRYVLVIHHFLFALAATTISTAFEKKYWKVGLFMRL